MTDKTREVLDLIFEFLLSMFILAGAGFLIYRGIASELGSGVITLIVGYWFTKRSNESAVNNLLRQSPTVTPILNTNDTPVVNLDATVVKTGNNI